MLLSPFVGQKLGTFISSENARDLLVLTELVEAGKLVPAVERTFSLSEAPARRSRRAELRAWMSFRHIPARSSGAGQEAAAVLRAFRRDRGTVGCCAACQAARAEAVVGSKSAFVRRNRSCRSAHSCSTDGRPQNQ